MAQNKTNTKIVIDKRKLDTLLRLNCSKEIIFELICTGKFKKTGDDLVDEYLSTLVDVKVFKNWGGTRANAGKKRKPKFNQDDYQDENQVDSNLDDIDKDKDIDKDIDKDYLNLTINNSNNSKNEILKIFLKNYEKVFLNLPLIDENMKNKMVEILENNPQIVDKLEDIFRKLQKEEFYFKDGKRFKPNLAWLLKDSNFIKFANGEMVTQKVKQVETSNIYEITKRVDEKKEKERQEQKEREKEENNANLHTREELTTEQREKISKTIEQMRNFRFKGV